MIMGKFIGHSTKSDGKFIDNSFIPNRKLFFSLDVESVKKHITKEHTQRETKGSIRTTLSWKKKKKKKKE